MRTNWPKDRDRPVPLQETPDFGGLWLGCPQWAHRPWTKSIFPKTSSPREAFTHYARVFNAVEGNTTFYATPPAEIVHRWSTQIPSGFRLVCKLPREVTHDRLLGPGALEIALRFLEHMAPLGERIEDILIQLPAHFDERRFELLYRFLMALPRPRGYTVELRASSLCQGPYFDEVNTLLSAARVERAWMDTRGLRAAPPPLNEPTRMTQLRKPDLPVFPLGLGPRPMVRYVAHPKVEANRPWLESWAEVFAVWLAEGRRPYFFAHAPGETAAPQVASLFYDCLRARVPRLPARPVWPSEAQLGLF